MKRARAFRWRTAAIAFASIETTESNAADLPSATRSGTSSWDQTLTLIWFESGELPSALEQVRSERRWEIEGRELPYRREDQGDGEFGLKELDGNLRWPSKKRRS